MVEGSKKKLNYRHKYTKVLQFGKDKKDMFIQIKIKVEYHKQRRTKKREREDKNERNGNEIYQNYLFGIYNCCF